eukprot:TRINITY_DN963_c0_g1_i1.p1 TRINITY_DN963_c0_g1~~TRINITY_DN963_c0_g1_i1.p1  ORF type:complete len:308 (-),score=85.61 TRINITY_DN963_c0_g1_i1:21-944(-)
MTEENNDNTTQTTTPEKPLRQKKERRFFVIGERMKAYEAEATVKLDPSLPYLLRLDGHKFSKYTRPFNKPYDERISRAMVKTTEQLVDTFGAMSGYTCSDEITLIFPVDESLSVEERAEKVLDYSGKIQKIVSLSAGLASSLFTLYIREEVYDPVEEERLYNHVYGKIPYFDSRVCQVPKNAELVNNMMWRASYDYRRNSISGLAQAYFSQKQLDGKSTKDQLAMLEEKGVFWEECPEWYKYGTIVKKERYLKEAEYKGEPLTVIRGRMTSKSIEIDKKFDEEQAEYLLGKYWPEAEEVTEFINNQN